MDRIGDRIESVATLNEPWCVSYLSHFLGHHAPGKKDIRATARAMHHVNLAHGEAMERLRARGQKNCGIVLNFDYAVPADDTPASHAAADRQDAIFNRWFIEAISKGTYPQVVLDGLGAHMPKGWEDDMAKISKPIDWLGVNYYTRNLIAEDTGAVWPATTSIADTLPKTDMGWSIFPEGLQAFLERLSKDYVGDLPIFVTENGMAGDDHLADDAIADPIREKFVNDHIMATKDAIANGANVQGFFYWSLLDNYEWAFGYDKCFGIVHVDYETQVRTPKQYVDDIGGAAPVATCVAVAGPVHNGAATMTNLDWTMDLQTLRLATQAGTVDILNDLQAQGHAIGHLTSENLMEVVRGNAAGKTSKAHLVIGVGTGFNAAPVFDTGHGRIVPASESGHVTLPTRTSEQERLSLYVGQKHGFPAVEDVLSGRGLERVYQFVRDDIGGRNPADVNA